MRNDNPYSEAQFKTLKYCPAFPDRFGSIAHARAFCEVFFDHYNHVHRHSGIGLHTPASVHYGTANEIREQRVETLKRRLQREPRPLPASPTRTTETPDRCLDQPAPTRSPHPLTLEMSQTA